MYNRLKEVPILVKAMFFDLDGTICNTLKDLASCCNRALKDYGLQEHPIDAYRYIVGNGIDAQMQRSIAKEYYTQSLAEQVKERFKSYYVNEYMVFTTQYDGMENTLEELLRMGIKLAVISNKPDTFTKQIVKAFYPGKFEMAVGNIEGRPIKPNPEVLLEMMQEMQVEPNECIYCGDSDVDMLTAERAGMYKIGALWGFRDKEELENAGANILINEPYQILDVVTKYQNK